MQNHDLVLRRLDPETDVGALQQVLESAPRYSLNISGRLQPVDAAAKVFEARPAFFDFENKYVYGIHMSSKLIGCIDVLRGFPSNEIAMIGLLLIGESHQEKGLGKTSYRLLESTFQSWREISKIRISIVVTNIEFLDFWTKLGFRESGLRRPYENGSVRSEAVILEKILAEF